jgi:glutamate formiminotransferase/formiminotetrahydrofolate cyclodeaminase
MQRIVECVPNFSEGRDRAKIDAIARAIESVRDVALLDVDPGAETNRTVVTFVGPPDAVAEAAFRAIETAAGLIDMRGHSGAHPRIGATDVCPFVPVRGVEMEDCAELARRVGARVGRELGIPVYLYERAASRPERRNLADVRAGEYEGLAVRPGDPRWTPDFGPDVFHAKAGATVIGAREFLIAYNVNLNTRSKKLAHEIALDVRESGRRVRDAEGRPVRDKRGELVMTPGKLKECKAVGWYIPEYGAAQVSINLTNHRVTPVHVAFDAVVEAAESRGIRVTGSELVGLIPLDAIREAGVHYLERQGLSAGVPESDLIATAVKSLGLDDLAAFDPARKIIEYRLRRKDALAGLSVSAFADELSRDSPAPGGGSVAALLGNLSAALSSMVASLTFGKKGNEPSLDDAMNELGKEAQRLKDEFRDDVDRDADSFHAVMAARKMSKATPEDAAARERTIADATKRAIEAPLGILQRSVHAAELAERVAEDGNRSSLSDAGVAALAALACAEGAWYNVLINLADVDDPEWSEATADAARAALARSREIAGRVTKNVERRLAEAARIPQRT